VEDHVRDFRDLTVWQKAHEVALLVYKMTRGFPVNERYGLTIQLRRAACSVPANIVEGIARGTDRDTARFLVIARASATELEYHLLLARDLGLISESTHKAMTGRIVEVRRILGGFLATLKAHGSRLMADG
jgi:four helix bundle protein